MENVEKELNVTKFNRLFFKNILFPLSAVCFVVVKCDLGKCLKETDFLGR